MAERIQRYRVIMEVRVHHRLCVRLVYITILTPPSFSKWSGSSHPRSRLNRHPKVCRHDDGAPRRLKIVLLPAIAAALQSQNTSFMALSVQIAEVHSELETLKAKFKARVGGTRDPFARVS